ncbi:MAG: ribonucleoside-diphosphate reductase subunit alpha [Acetobacter sp.]|nr:ribonucleoside-diphosphate reductase subunit alpha [Acetobacter sp.]
MFVGTQDIIQLSGYFPVHVTRERDDLLTLFGKETLSSRYLLSHESFQDVFARVASRYADNTHHAQRLYDYMSQHWFMPATPILSNGGTTRGLPISCFVNEVEDSLESIAETWNENVWLAARGGGIGTYWGNLRSIGEAVGHNGKTSGVIPFIRVMDSLTLAISQGSLRRGSAAVYLPVDHPEIEEFIDIRRPTGGDPNRKALNLHNGVCLTDDFMRAVELGEEYILTSPHTGKAIKKVSARDIWQRILMARIETGEPYLVFIDTVNKNLPVHHKLAGMEVRTSNLCAEIMQPTGLDKRGTIRTAVCCLASLNLENWALWKEDQHFIPDIMAFLDNVLQDFIDSAPKETFQHAIYSARASRAVGLGVMGFHSFLQSQNVCFDSVMAKVWNNKIFKYIREQADKASADLALKRAPCPDAAAYGIQDRFSYKLAIAPTASISVIAGGSSPGIDPFTSNAYLHKTLSGSFSIRNKHLEKLLKEKNHDTPDVWNAITTNRGSVQHLDFLTDHEKAVFKTAFEIDQRWIIELAGDRAPYIDQGQSVNLFLPADIHKRDLHRLHFSAWEKGVKSLYYCRSMAVNRAENVGHKLHHPTTLDEPTECLACQ